MADSTINVNGKPEAFPNPTSGTLKGFKVKVLTLACYNWLLSLKPHELQPRQLRFNRSFWNDLTGKGRSGFTPFGLRGLADLPVVVGKSIACGAGRLGTLILAAMGFEGFKPQPETVKAILRAGVISVYHKATCGLETIRTLICDNDAGKELWNQAQRFHVYKQARNAGKSGLRAVKLCGNGDRVKLEKLYLVATHKPEIIDNWVDSIGTDNPIPTGEVAKLGKAIRDNLKANPATSDTLGDAGREIVEKLEKNDFASSKPKPTSPVDMLKLAQSFDNDKGKYTFTGMDLALFFRQAAGYANDKGKLAGKGMFVRSIRSHAAKQAKARKPQRQGQAQAASGKAKPKPKPKPKAKSRK